MKTIKDITGNSVKVTDLDAAIRQCKDCIESPYKMESGHTVGENYVYMLNQLLAIQQKQRRNNWLPGTKNYMKKANVLQNWTLPTKSDDMNHIIRHPCIGIVYTEKNW